MNTQVQKSSSVKPNPEPKVKPLVSSVRWTSQRSHPRLVSLSWAQVATPTSKR